MRISCSDLFAYLQQRLDGHGFRASRATLQELLATDVELNSQGLEVWLDRGAPGWKPCCHQPRFARFASMDSGQIMSRFESITVNDLGPERYVLIRFTTRASITRTPSPLPARERSCASIPRPEVSISPARWSQPTMHVTGWVTKYLSRDVSSVKRTMAEYAEYARVKATG